MSAVLFLTVCSVAEGTQDDILAAPAKAIADSLRSKDRGVMLDLPNSALSMLGTVNQDRVFYLIMAPGGVAPTGYEGLPAPENTPLRGQRVFSTSEFRGEEVRAVSVARAVGPGSWATNIVATVVQTRLGLKAISRRITATAMAPILRMTGAVTRRGPKDLRPVTSDTPSELVPLVEALNGFMSRLRASLSRTRISSPRRRIVCAHRWPRSGRRPK